MKRFLIQRSVTKGVQVDHNTPGAAGDFPVWMDCWGSDKDEFGNSFIACKATAESELAELRRIYSDETYRLVQVVESD